jgi:hypothetical protein
MAVTITELAEIKLKEVMKDADLKNPALKIVFAGFG